MVDGMPTYTDLMMNNPDGLSPTEARGKYIMALNGWPMEQDFYYFKQTKTEHGQRAIDTWKDCNTDRILPILSFTPEENKIIATRMSEINTYTDEMLDKFVVGKESMDDYYNFVATMYDMGIKEVIDIYQTAYDRYKLRQVIHK